VCFAGQIGENSLCNVLGPVRSLRLAQCGGIDETDVPFHEFRKGFFRGVLDVTAKQFDVISHWSPPIPVAEWQTGH
jgi:hypothetical protein